MDGMAESSTIPQQAGGETMFAPGRVVSVDMLRGLTIALMILVNDPGDWEHLFRQLDHAPWNGWTLTDLVFPNFLFLMGVSMVFSMGARAARGHSQWARAGKIVRAHGQKSLRWRYDPGLSFWDALDEYALLRRADTDPRCYSLIAGLILLATITLRAGVGSGGDCWWRC